MSVFLTSFFPSPHTQSTHICGCFPPAKKGDYSYCTLMLVCLTPSPAGEREIMGGLLVHALGPPTAGRLSLSPVTRCSSQLFLKHMNTSLLLGLETVWRCVHSTADAGVIVPKVVCTESCLLSFTPLGGLSRVVSGLLCVISSMWSNDVTFQVRL